ncbi:hypothetical protein RB195_005676 [Necator americanus]|uniref:Uncharacterized protein n=1 Tax=Necator americanus TaxID=51031 RepID=A0ABR1BP19_NECAM
MVFSVVWLGRILREGEGDQNHYKKMVLPRRLVDKTSGLVNSLAADLTVDDAGHLVQRTEGEVTGSRANKQDGL